MVAKMLTTPAGELSWGFHLVTSKKGETKIYQEHLKFGLNQDLIPHCCWFNPPVVGAEKFPWPPCGRYI
jgi:hypothetical protein